MAVVSRIVVRNSDLSGAAYAETVSLDLAGVLRDVAKGYGKITLDLTPAETTEIDAIVEEIVSNLRAALDNGLGHVFAAHASVTAAGAQTAGGASVKTTGNVDPVRSWARANGFEVGDRGRIKGEILDAYKSAHPELSTDLDEPSVADLDEIESETV